MPDRPSADGLDDAGTAEDTESEDLSSLSYEQAREELIAVVQRLESGGAPLAESLALWERGEKLAAVCQQWLDGARAKVEAARRGTGDTGATEGS